MDHVGRSPTDSGNRPDGSLPLRRYTSLENCRTFRLDDLLSTVHGARERTAHRLRPAHAGVEQPRVCRFRDARIGRIGRIVDVDARNGRHARHAGRRRRRTPRCAAVSGCRRACRVLPADGRVRTCRRRRLAAGSRDRVRAAGRRRNCHGRGALFPEPRTRATPSSSLSPAFRSGSRARPAGR